MSEHDIPLPDEHAASVAQAFSYKALVYDEFGREHHNLARMRSKVRRQVSSLLEPGDSILELAAGTGADAVYFAERGFRVLATDLAPGMAAKMREKVAAMELGENLLVRQLSFSKLEVLPAAQFDLVFSNMGGLNCIAELSQVTSKIPRLLKPGGWVVWVLMPRLCLWELAALLLGDVKTAFRRLSPHGSLATVEGVQFMTYYFNPSQVKDALGPEFALVSVKGVSVFTPPADRKNFVNRFPGFYRFLVGIENRFADRPPFNRWGDFYMITARYLPPSSA